MLIGIYSLLTRLIFLSMDYNPIPLSYVNLELYFTYPQVNDLTKGLECCSQLLLTITLIRCVGPCFKIMVNFNCLNYK